MKVRDWLTRKEDSVRDAGEGIVSDARSRLIANEISQTKTPEHGVRWGAYLQRVRESIAGLTTPVEVLQFAQSNIGFEHRGNIYHEGKFTALYERELETAFPHFAHFLNDFSDIVDSVPDTTYEHKGRLISNITFYLARIVMSCLTLMPKAPKVILEIGGGYGAPARAWLKNPIVRPRCYIILDIPESLFFSDVFLRKEFGNENVYYVTSDEALSVTILNKYPIILCPLPRMAALESLPVDLIVNTGSLQEMSEEWVDFYKTWLDRQKCCWFYSLNYFCQPINALWESGNLLSPRLSPRWVARSLRWNPPFIRMQADRDFLEALYEKDANSLDEGQQRVAFYRLMERCPTGDIFAELMDIVRQIPDAQLMLGALRFARRMPSSTPKEALWLCKMLATQTLADSNDRKWVSECLVELEAKRASGVEAYH